MPILVVRSFLALKVLGQRAVKGVSLGSFISIANIERGEEVLEKIADLKPYSTLIFFNEGKIKTHIIQCKPLELIKYNSNRGFPTKFKYATI